MRHTLRMKYYLESTRQSCDRSVSWIRSKPHETVSAFTVVNDGVGGCARNAAGIASRKAVHPLLKRALKGSGRPKTTGVQRRSNSMTSADILPEGSKHTFIVQTILMIAFNIHIMSVLLE